MFIKICLSIHFSFVFKIYILYYIITPKKCLGDDFWKNHYLTITCATFILTLKSITAITMKSNRKPQATSEWCHTLKLKSMVKTPPASVANSCLTWRIIPPTPKDFHVYGIFTYILLKFLVNVYHTWIVWVSKC